MAFMAANVARNVAGNVAGNYLPGNLASQPLLSPPVPTKRTTGEIAIIALIMVVVIAVVIAVLGAVAYFVMKGPQAPVGGTFADNAVSKTVHRGSMWHAATKVADIKNCKEDYENKNGNGLAFWSADGDACYTCPPGNLVNALGDMRKNKCTDPTKTVFDPTRDSPATFQRKGLGPDGLTPAPPGAFREGMAYWVCPNKTKRSGIRNGKPACLGQCEDLYPAIPTYDAKGLRESDEDFKNRIKNTYGSDFENLPPSGYQVAFQDALSGECYSCPDGFNRSGTSVTATNACSN